MTVALWSEFASMALGILIQTRLIWTWAAAQYMVVMDVVEILVSKHYVLSVVFYWYGNPEENQDSWTAI
jgi:hypothetical protein